MILNTTQIDSGQPIKPTMEQLDAASEFIELRELRKSEFSTDGLKRYMELIHIIHPTKVYKQAILETGNFTSDIFKENHNLFGMKMPHTRISTAIGENRGHAKYRHWTDSVDDYLEWQDFYMDNGWDMADYYSFLKDIPYAEDPRYINKLKQLP